MAPLFALLLSGCVVEIVDSTTAPEPVKSESTTIVSEQSVPSQASSEVSSITTPEPETSSSSVAPQEVKISSISFSEDCFNINVGHAITLDPIIEPANATNKELEYYLGDGATSVRLGENGAVFGTSIHGFATVYARAKDGSGVVGSCNVYVVASQSVIDPYLVVSSGTVNYVKAGSSFTLKGYCTQSYYTITWSLDSGLVATGSLSSNELTVATTSSGVYKARATNTYCETVVVTVVVYPSSVASTPAQSVSLSETSYVFPSLYTGHSFTAAVSPSTASQDLVWVGEGKGVSVSSGGAILTSADARHGKVYAFTMDGSAKYAVCDVSYYPPISGLRLSVDNMKIGVFRGSGALTLDAISDPQLKDLDIEWSSDNTNVATVSESGVVMGVAGGEAIITARYGEHSATCAITVED